MVVERNKRTGMIPIGNVRTDRIIPRLVQQFTPTEALAEIVKNGNDQYEILHLELKDEARIIVIFVAKGDQHDILMVLDIGGGMTPTEMAEIWAEWGGDHQGDEGEGEQGLGGKAAMQKLAGEFAEFSTYKDGHLTTAGFYNKENGVYPELPQILGSIEDAGEKKYFSRKFEDPKVALAEVLRAYDVDIAQEWKRYNSDELFSDDIPREALLAALEQRGTFSLVAMVDIQEQIPRSGSTRAQRARHNGAVFDLMGKLESEGQMRRALNDSWVFFVHQQSPKYTTFSLMEEAMPEALDGVEDVDIEIKGPFTDPETGRVFDPVGPCLLTLQASKIILTGKKWAKLKGIRVNDGRNSVWTEDVPPGNDAGAAQRIYGEFQVPSDELRSVATADRHKVPEIPSSRAIMEAMRKPLEEFRQKVADAIRTSKTASRDTKKEQDELDARMADIERLIDLEALFEDGGEVTGGPTERRAQILDRIYIENNENLTEATVPTGSEFKLRFRPVGIVPGTELNRVDGSLEQLRGVKNLEPYFDIVSSDDSVVEIKEGFVFHALMNGNATVKISSTELVTGEAEVELDITVVDLKELQLSLDPAPGPRGLVSDLIIQAEGVDGTIFSHENGGFEIEVDGPGSLHSRFPPRIKTSKGDPAEGKVIVRYHGGQESVLFSTTEEIHVPSSRGSDDGEKPGKKKFPTAILCGHSHGIPEEKVKLMPYRIPDTVNPDSGDITVKMEPIWESLGIVWINTESAESRAKLRNPSSGFSYTENSQEWKKYIAEVAVEVAIQTVMTEMVRRGEYILSPAVTSTHELRREAERKLVVLYEAMAEGRLEG